TFLTRSGIIASVHSFAQSDIGIYFVYFMGLILATTAGLIAWRWPLLRGKSSIESIASREAAFVVNNWVLLGAGLFIAISTVFPVISKWLWNEEVTVGPPFYNKWMAPLGLLLLLLMGTAPLFGWRKSSGDALRKAFRAPTITAGVTAVLHLAFGNALGAPAIVKDEAVGSSTYDLLLQHVGSFAPLVTVTLVAFNFAVVVQEFYRGIQARRSNAVEPLLIALFTLVSRSRRRYGGYIVHVGVGLMFLGFVGSSWSLEKEATLLPGEKATIGDYELTYKGSRMEVDTEKRMIFADLDAKLAGRDLGRVTPAQYIYMKRGNPTTEVATLNRLSEDLYVIVGSVDPATKRATFRFHVNPLVSWLWIGVLVMLSGATISLWPEVSFRRLGVWGNVRLAAGAATGVMFSVLIATAPARATSLKTVTVTSQSR
ncbi:MAG: hypothetical protein RJA70_3652, partial [Pseudomonadota bacterium]